MQRVVLSRVAKLGMAVLGCICAVGYLADAAAGERERVPVKTAMLFPIDNLVGDAGSQVIARLNYFVAGALSASRGYRVISYSDRLPSVKRLIAMRPDHNAVTAAPFSTDKAAINRAVAIADISSAELLVVGAVKKCGPTSDGTVEVIATAEMIETSTGESVQMVAVTGYGAKPADAAEDAGRKIVAELTGEDCRFVLQVAEEGIEAGKKGAGKASVIVFPFAVTGSQSQTSETLKQRAADLCILVGEGMRQTRRFSTVELSSRNPSIKRAIGEGKASENDISQAIDTVSSGQKKARQLAGIVGARVAVIGSIDRYEFRGNEGKAEITATLQMLDVTSGKVMSTVTATGVGAAKPGATEETASIAATYDAGEKLLVEIAAASPVELTGTPEGSGDGLD